MKTSAFDDLVKQKFDDNDFDYDPDHWPAIQLQLKAKRQRIVAFAWPLSGIAAGVLLFSSILIYSNHDKVTSTAIGNKFSSETRSVIAQNALSTQLNSPTISKGTPTTTQVGHSHFLPKHEGPVSKATASRVVVQSNEAIIQEEKKSDQTSINDPKSPTVVAQINLNDPVAEQNVSKDLKIYDQMVAQDDVGNKKNSNTHISVTGGVNYGSLNRSYALGGTAHRQINERLFLEGDIAFINGSRNTTTVTYVNGGPLNFIGIAPRLPQYANSVSNFDYLQISPSIGYKVGNKISLCIGADVQRLVLTDPLPDNLVMNDSKILPQFDFGLIGKTEYRLTKRLNAGLQYREGLNNFITSSTKFIDRSYFQVQVKFNIF